MIAACIVFALVCALGSVDSFSGKCYSRMIHEGSKAAKLKSAFQLAVTNGESHFGGHQTVDDAENLLARSSSRLSHAMLQVPSVDKTVAYWKATANGQVMASSKLSDSKTDDELRSAFLLLGNGKTTEECFALELVRNKHKNFQVGNAVSYLGVSKLVQYASKEDLINVIIGTAPKPERTEPNGIPVQFCASAPGDYFSRFSLHTVNMEETIQFYTDILGMSIAASDEKMLCLRYKSKKQDKEDTSKSFYGVPTTLVFKPLSAELDKGNCFDHLVIATLADIDEVYNHLQDSLGVSSLGCSLFMKPIEMFGQKVCGVMDPNGYKIILSGKA